MADKVLLDCVARAGAALVLLRHHLERADKLFDAVDEALKATEPDFKARGWRFMQYSEAKRKLLEARCAPHLVMEAHDSLRKNLAEFALAEPTDEDLKKAVGTLNWR